MSEIYPGGDAQYSNNLGLALWGADEVVVENFLLIDAAIGSGSSVQINGTVIPHVNFVNSATVTFAVVGSNVSATAVASGGVSSFIGRTGAVVAVGTDYAAFYAPISGGSSAWANLTGDLTETQVIPWDGPTVGTPDTSLSRISAGLIGVGTGAQGSHAGSLSMANITVSGTTSFAAGSIAVAALSADTIGLTDSTGLFTVTGSPATLGGSLTLSAFASQSQNYVLAGPATGGAGAAAFRALVAADIPNSTITPLWSNLGNAAAALTLANANYATTFNQTSAVAWLWANTTAAVLATNQSSPIINLGGTYFGGAAGALAASAVDTWSVQNVLAVPVQLSTTASITNISETAGNVVTLTLVASTFVAGQLVELSGFGTGFGDWLNGYTVSLTTATAVTCTFTDPTSHGLLASHATTGTPVMTQVSGLSTLAFTHSGSSVNSKVQLPSSTVLEWSTDTGISRLAAGSLAIGNGTAGNSSGTLLASVYGFGATVTSTAPDTGISRSSGGVVLIGNGTQGDSTGTLICTNLQGNSGTLYFQTGGHDSVGFLGAGALALKSSWPLSWGTGDANGTQDTGISRIGVASLAIGNGTAGNTSGTLTAATINATTSYQANGTPGVTQTAIAVGTLATIEGIVTTFTGVSDERLKNHAPYTGGLEEILGITPIRFTYNELGQKFGGWDKDHVYVGFSAQNVQKSIPEAIQGTEGPEEWLSFDDRPVIAALVNAVKELTKRIKSLESKQQGEQLC